MKTVACTVTLKLLS